MLLSHPPTISNIDARLRSRAAGGGSKSPSLIEESSDAKTMDLNGTNQFESAKREASKLERQLEEKVARYQQVRWINADLVVRRGDLFCA